MSRGGEGPSGYGCFLSFPFLSVLVVGGLGWVECVAISPVVKWRAAVVVYFVVLR